MNALYRIVIGLSTMACAIAATAASPAIVTEEFMIPAVDPGIRGS